jgi:hypothetical protein
MCPVMHDVLNLLNIKGHDVQKRHECTIIFKKNKKRTILFLWYKGADL